MKVYIGPYKNYVGPYQLVDMLFFWHKKFPSPKLLERWDYKLHDNISDWLANTWVNTVCEWIESHRHRKIKIKIHDYDSWNVDGTLAPIILPLLKKLQECKQGSPEVDLNDVPEYMRTTSTKDYDPQYTFDFYTAVDEDKMKYSVHDRWNWVLGEMIWAFEQIQPDYDWEDQYWKVKPELDLSTYPEDEGKKLTPLRWKVEGKCDWTGYNKHQDRIRNGLRLFGTYYQGLWS